MRSKKEIDRILYFDKLLATDVTQNRYRQEDVEYTESEIAGARLLCKNLDGLAFATPLFAEMYPDATFFGIVRNGLAVCEGHLRRGISARAYGKLYARVCSRILEDSNSIPNFNLIRYEQLTSDTLGTASLMFRLAGLDSSLVKRFRLVVGNEGDENRTGGTADELKWYAPQDFATMISPGVDEAQIGKVSVQDRAAFMKEAGDVMERLGYENSGEIWQSDG